MKYKKNTLSRWKMNFIKIYAPIITRKQIAKLLNVKTYKIMKFCVTNNIGRCGNNIRVGDTFGKLTILVQSNKKSAQGRSWICECECGNIILVASQTLNSKHTQSCGCSRIEAISSGCGDIPGWFYGRLKNNAEMRNLPCPISIEYLDWLIKSQNYKCALSGVELTLFKTNIRENKGKSTASLDRINNLQGYVEGNVQFVHKTVNYLKNNYTEEELVWWCEQIYKHHNKGKENEFYKTSFKDNNKEGFTAKCA